MNIVLLAPQCVKQIRNCLHSLSFSVFLLQRLQCLHVGYFAKHLLLNLIRHAFITLHHRSNKSQRKQSFVF